MAETTQYNTIQYGDISVFRMAEQSIEITSQSASLSEILSELETKSAPESDRKHAYAKFSR